MEMAVIVIIAIALIVSGGMIMAQGYMSSVDDAASSIEEITAVKGEAIRTEISLLSATQLITDNIEVTLRNSGQIKLASFSKWDFIVQYHDSGGTYHTTWLPYTDGTLGNNQWQESGIYLVVSDNTTEVFEPNILNPSEELRIEAKLSPLPQEGTDIDVIISTPNGVRESGSFIY